MLRTLTFQAALVCLALGAAPARAEDDCSYRRVNEGALGGLRNQGDIGTCYAYASADLLTYCMNEGKSAPVDPMTDEIFLRHRVSANDVAFNFVEKFSDYRLDNVEKYLSSFEEDGGDPRRAMIAIQQKGGACMENIMTSDLDSYLTARTQAGRMGLDYQHSTSTKKLFAKLAAFKLLFDRPGHELACKDEAENYFNDRKFNVNRTYTCDKEREVRFRWLSDNPVGAQVFSNENFTELLRTTTQENFFSTLDNKICGGLKKGPGDHANHRRPLPAACAGDPRQIVARGNDATPLLREIDERLSATVPVGIGVFSSFLKSNDDSALDAKTDGHAMVITGREKRGDSCKYRIRNSWGPGCKSRYSDTGFEVSDRDAASYPKYGTKFVECDPADGGYIYVSRETLARVLQFVYYPRPRAEPAPVAPRPVRRR